MIRLNQLLTLLFFISLCAVFSNCQKNIESISPILPEKKWTFMFYCDEDCAVQTSRFDIFRNSICSGENTNVIIMHDTRYKPVIYWYVDENYKAVEEKNMGELNVGNPVTLTNFIKFCKSEYPAERYILSFSGHGAGWLGACWDVTNEGDWLSPDDIKTALESTGGVDMVLFTGPCLMGAIESVYEIRIFTTAYIGSENRSTYWFWQNPMMKINEILKVSPEINTPEFALSIINLIWDNSFSDLNYQYDLTMSAIRTDKVDELVQSIDQLSLMYLQDISSFSTYIDSSYRQFRYYRNSAIDLYDMIQNMKSLETDSIRYRQLETTETRLVNTIIEEYHGEGMEGSHGLSIYFPHPDSLLFNPYYRDPAFNLDFAQDTHWDELLMAYWNSRGN